MTNPLSDATRDHIREYIWRTKPTRGMTQEKLAEEIGYNRKSLNEFVNGHLPKMPADATEKFYKLYDEMDRSTPWHGSTAREDTVEYLGDAAYEAEIIALALDGLTRTLRNPEETDATKYLETIHVLYGLLKEITGRVNFESEATASSESNVI